MNYERIRVDNPAERVARITLARADRGNAQDMLMLDELDAAYAAAMADPEIRVVILAADGKHFSTGHDLSDLGWAGDDQLTMMAVEEEKYIGYCRKWRDLPKPTIAQVQGRVIAGGLMLVWPCDLVIASSDAKFSDPVVAFGIGGHEYFVHTWELGHRKAKEMLFRGSALTAEECHQLGMVNHVVERDELESTTLRIASEIAEQPMAGLKLAKLAVNQSLDAQGQTTAVQQAFGLHHLAHAHARAQFDGLAVDPDGARRISEAAKRQ